MTVNPRARHAVAYPERTVLRAQRAMRCAPFQRALFTTMVQQSVSLGAIAGNAGLQNQYTQRPLSELAVESELLWLIQVGLLRREVDGQGLTDSFRVTPLGRQIVQSWPVDPVTDRVPPSIGDRLRNAWSRWFRLPI